MTDDQLDAAAVLGSIDALLVETLSEDEDDAFVRRTRFEPQVGLMAGF